MSSQPFPRDVSIKCRNDNRPNFLTRESFNPTKEIEHSHAEHISLYRRTCLAEEKRYLKDIEHGPYTCPPNSLTALQPPRTIKSQIRGALARPAHSTL